MVVDLILSPSAGKRWCLILSYSTAFLNLDCPNVAQPETEAKLNKHFLTGGNTCPRKPLPFYQDLLNKNLDQDIGCTIAGVVLGDSVNAVDEKFCRSTAVLHVACWASISDTSGSVQTARPLNCRIKTCFMLGPLRMQRQKTILYLSFLKLWLCIGSFPTTSRSI